MKPKIYLVLRVEAGTGKVIGNIRAFIKKDEAICACAELNDLVYRLKGRCEYIVEEIEAE